MQKRIKFKGPFTNSISFDKKEIRKKIFVSTFRQARRCADIYDALIQEFYEEGCLTSAKYFKILVDKECKLYENSSIRDRISEEPKLLLSIFDSCKMAEKAALSGQCNGPVICTRLLLQCILVFENFDKKYDWILIDVFRIIVKIADKVCQAEEVSKEPLCQIYYKFGTYLSKHDLEEAVKYLESAFDLAQGTNWIRREDINDNKSLHFSSVIAHTYASALLKYAKNMFCTAPENSISNIQKALVILTREGIERNKSIYIEANLDMADLQLKAQNYETSISILENAVKLVKPNVQGNIEYLKFLSRYNLLKGVCFERVKKYDIALAELYKSLIIIRQLNMKHEEGIVLMNIAKVYIDRGRSQFPMAESCLRQAKEIFVALKDVFNTKKTSYLMANLKLHNIHPLILDLIKYSSTNYCDKYRLTRWKSICLPFWRNLRYSLENEERNRLCCILKATEIPDKKDERQSFRRKASQQS